LGTGSLLIRFINCQNKKRFFMKKKSLFLPILFLVSYYSFSQGVGIGTTVPDASAALDITHTGKGLLIPRMSTGSINAIASPAKGLLVYDSLANKLMVNTGTPAAPSWQPVASNSSGWNLTGNSGINPVSQFIGTTDNRSLRFRIGNTGAGELNPVTKNISWGLRAGASNTTGFSNIAIGTDALKLNTVSTNLVAMGDSSLLNNNDGTFNTGVGSKSLSFNTSGSSNTAIGFESLRFNTTGSVNTAIGARALSSNTTGRFNAATGYSSLLFNTTGESNTATGSESLLNNITGHDNTATGSESLFFNSTGSLNTAFGSQSLKLNITGSVNTATGTHSLFSNTTGSENTAVGNESLFSNSVGTLNTAVGNNALFQNIDGSENTALGDSALLTNHAHFNTAVGAQALQRTSNSQFNTAVGFNAGRSFNMGFNNTIVGANADVTQDDLTNCVAVGESARCTAINQVRFGNSLTTSIGGVVGFTNLSDGRYKKNIQEKVKGIDFIMKLRPVTYQLDIPGINRKLNVRRDGKRDDQSKEGITENEKTIFSGFVAQEVEQAARAAGYDFSGVDKPKNANDFYGLRYADFVVPLVKAMQEQQQMIDELKKQNEELKKNNSVQKNLNESLLKRLEKLESSFEIKK
jgi:trimeric autotransporter adhesin